MDRSTPSLKLINSCWRRILVIGSAGPETTESGGGVAAPPSIFIRSENLMA